MVAKIRERYRDGRLIPFIGAGFSLPLGLPLWDELVAVAAKELGFEPELFELHGDNPELLGYYELRKKEGVKELVDWMNKSFHSTKADKKRVASIQHKSLAGLTEIRTVYTTNYEHHIERAFEDMKRPTVVRSTLGDFSAPVPEGAVEVLKFHGDLETAAAGGHRLVLTEGDYFDRFALESPFDQRLRADLLGNSFLFMGYRFSDRNTRYIWHRMHRMAKDYGEQLEHRSYYVAFELGEVQRALLEQWGIDAVVLEPRNHSQQISDFLEKLGGP